MGTLDHIFYNYRKPMDKGAWEAKVHGITKSDQATEHST